MTLDIARPAPDVILEKSDGKHVRVRDHTGGPIWEDGVYYPSLQDYLTYNYVFPASAIESTIQGAISVRQTYGVSDAAMPWNVVLDEGKPARIITFSSHPYPYAVWSDEVEMNAVTSIKPDLDRSI